MEAYDLIGYDEPADFYYPVRETLGGALLRANRHTEAANVFGAELKLHPNNGRALYGLWNALKRIAAGASPEEKRAIFSGTAARVYRLSF